MMTPLSSGFELSPISTDVRAALELSRAAIIAAFSRSLSAAEAEPTVAAMADRIRRNAIDDGRLVRHYGRPVGFVYWETGHPSGITLQQAYLTPGEGRPTDYAAVLDLVGATEGSIVFSPGGLVGLSEEEENVLMRSRGFERFSRSEMRWPPATMPPLAATDSRLRIRSVRPEDELAVARLHLAAFSGTFDQYLYLSDVDPAVDAARTVGEMMQGRFGEFLGAESSFAEWEGRPVGASLAVRAPYGPLLISVMVDPSVQGHGVGRSLVLANVRSLRARGETVIALNVTEGNWHAVRLYEHLGFVRTIGPEHTWYSRAAIPVAPGEKVSDRAAAPPYSGTSDSGAHQTPRT
jgi:ribosomal protein S18 acetylase RimI-like enzyme